MPPGQLLPLAGSGALVSVHTRLVLAHLSTQSSVGEEGGLLWWLLRENLALGPRRELDEEQVTSRPSWLRTEDLSQDVGTFCARTQDGPSQAWTAGHPQAASGL